MPTTTSEIKKTELLVKLSITFPTGEVGSECQKTSILFPSHHMKISVKTTDSSPVENAGIGAQHEIENA